MMPAVTSQTVGPYFAIGASALLNSDIAGGASGERFTLEGRVLDANREPIPDALIEIWQADAAGKYGSETGGGFRGFGRAATDENGGFRFTSIKPGRVSGPHGTLQAPHLVVTVFMRGLLIHLHTRVYFPDEAAANAVDPILSLVPGERRATLVASVAGGDVLRWDVRMQGEDETVFFDV